MLKIKDNVYLKSLAKKFGFHKGYKSELFHDADTPADDNVRISIETREIEYDTRRIYINDYDYYSNEYLDVIYDLIKSGKVEKIKEE